jgi:hypothetical protein
VQEVTTIFGSGVSDLEHSCNLKPTSAIKHLVRVRIGLDGGCLRVVFAQPVLGTWRRPDPHPICASVDPSPLTQASPWALGLLKHSVAPSCTWHNRIFP